MITYIALGSNLGDRSQNLAHARELAGRTRSHRQVLQHL